MPSACWRPPTADGASQPQCALQRNEPTDKAELELRGFRIIEASSVNRRDIDVASSHKSGADLADREHKLEGAHHLGTRPR